MRTEFNPNLNFTSFISYNETLHRGLNRAFIEIRTGNAQKADKFVKSLEYLKNDGENNFYEVQMAHKSYEPEYRCYLCKNGEKIAKNEKTTKGAVNIMELFIDYVENTLNHKIKPDKRKAKERLIALKSDTIFGEML